MLEFRAQYIPSRTELRRTALRSTGSPLLSLNGWHPPRSPFDRARHSHLCQNTTRGGVISSDRNLRPLGINRAAFLLLRCGAHISLLKRTRSFPMGERKKSVCSVGGPGRMCSLTEFDSLDETVR